jgi:hypothetical protein
MKDRNDRIPWTQPGWRTEVTAWIHEALDRRRIRVTGPIEQPHVRPWSTVLRVPTSEGVVYFKAGAPGFAHEPATLLVLARRRPHCVPRPLATDIECGWMLLGDLGQEGGTRLRETLRTDRDLAHWERLLPIYAELQTTAAGQTSELLALGAPDCQAAGLPVRFERLLAEADTLTSKERERLHALAPRLAALCAELEAGPVPAAALEHGDLHDGNIFVQKGGYVFFDWGDCTITHPFLSLRSVLVSVENTLGLAVNAPELDRLRDAYLEPWIGARGANRNDLRDTLALALRVAPVSRALTWHRAVSNLPAPLRNEYALAVPALLREFLEGETAVPHDA